MDGLATTPADLIQSHVPCVGCGYDLYASNRSGNCPECGCDIAPSADMASVLHDPANAHAARSMARSLLISSIFAGLCPASCLLLLSTENIVGAIAMSVAFVTCAVFAAKGEAQRRRIVGAQLSAMHRTGSPLVPDIIAGVGLLLVNLAAYLFAFQEMSRGEYASSRNVEAVGAALVGTGFFLLCVTAWRALPTWRAHADIARLIHGKRLEKLLHFLSWAKAIYETIWLVCCWTPFAARALGRSFEEIAVGLAFGALFGLMGFGVVWILMIIAHAILLVQIRKVTALGINESQRASARRDSSIRV